MDTCDWRPFVKAAIERNPVSLEKASSSSIDEVRAWLEGLESASIYDGNRLAQPDEVANYGRGDGLEKAFLLANVMRRREPGRTLQLVADHDKIVVRGSGEFAFSSAKTLSAQVDIAADGTVEVAC
jgi:hypothetical protein